MSDEISQGKLSLKVMRTILDTHVKLHATDLSLVSEEARPEMRYRLERLRDLLTDKLVELDAP